MWYIDKRLFDIVAQDHKIRENIRSKGKTPDSESSQDGTYMNE